MFLISFKPFWCWALFPSAETFFVVDVIEAILCDNIQRIKVRMLAASLFWRNCNGELCHIAIGNILRHLGQMLNTFLASMNFLVSESIFATKLKPKLTSPFIVGARIADPTSDWVVVVATFKRRTLDCERHCVWLCAMTNDC